MGKGRDRKRRKPGQPRAGYRNRLLLFLHDPFIEHIGNEQAFHITAYGYEINIVDVPR